MESENKMTPEHLRELLQAFALGTILALQAFEVSADLSQLQFQFGVTTACMRYKNTNKKKKHMFRDSKSNGKQL